eukprot:6189709-Amphidinium_carterae.1
MALMLMMLSDLDSCAQWPGHHINKATGPQKNSSEGPWEQPCGIPSATAALHGGRTVPTIIFTY